MATHHVTFLTHGKEVAVDGGDDEYLFDAAARAGLKLPASCLQGWCLSCACRLLQGMVDQHEARRYFPQDEAAGFVLICSAYARSDCRILTHQKDAMRQHRTALGLPTPQG